MPTRSRFCRRTTCATPSTSSTGATAADALAQIRAKGYAEPYRARGLPIWAVGLAFDSKTRRLIDADVEKVQ